MTPGGFGLHALRKKERKRERKESFRQLGPGGTRPGRRAAQRRHPLVPQSESSSSKTSDEKEPNEGTKWVPNGYQMGKAGERKGALWSPALTGTGTLASALSTVKWPLSSSGQGASASSRSWASLSSRGCQNPFAKSSPQARKPYLHFCRRSSSCSSSSPWPVPVVSRGTLENGREHMNCMYVFSIRTCQKYECSSRHRVPCATSLVPGSSRKAA